MQTQPTVRLAKLLKIPNSHQHQRTPLRARDEDVRTMNDYRKPLLVAFGPVTPEVAVPRFRLTARGR